MQRSPRPKRQHVIKIRVDDVEKSLLQTKADAAGVTVAALLRDRINQVAIVNRADWQLRTFQLARIGANANQLVAYCHVHKGAADAHEIIVALLTLERAIRSAFGLEREGQPS